MNKKIYKVGIYVVELVVPDDKKDLRYSKANNIDVYDEKEKFLWNITELLEAYSNDNGLKYYSELYFDVKPIDDTQIYCIGFNNHCEIDLNKGKILKLVNNR